MRVNSPKHESAQATAIYTTGYRLIRESVAMQCLLLAVLGLLFYGNTFDVPFYFDDFTSIRDNPVIQGIGNLPALFAYSPQRFIGYFSFALNYQVNGYEVFGYHLINLLIHILASFSVLLLTRQLAQLSTRQEGTTSDWLRRDLPLLVALLFLAHPLQTQAITYIAQRLAALSALFFLSSTVCYLAFRTTADGVTRILNLGGFVLFALLALFTKQNAVTLPAILLLIELIFLGLKPRRIFFLALPLLTVGVAAVLAYYFLVDSRFFQSLSEATQETELVSRSQYLAIQSVVLWGYIGKFVLPLGLHLEYDIPVTSFTALLPLLSGAVHIAVITAAIFLTRRFPLPAFGILFYYLTQTVESGFIPIRDFAFEHRTYLPNVGLCLLFGWSLLTVIRRFATSLQVGLICLAVISLLGGLTFLRNQVWRDPVAFYQHETKVSPESMRAWSMLGESYLRADRAEDALVAYRQAAGFLPSTLDRGNNTEVAFFQNYLQSLDRLGYQQEALDLWDTLNIEVQDPPIVSKFLSIRGNILANASRLTDAQADLERALQLDPTNLDAWMSFGKIRFLRGDTAAAAAAMQQVLERDPDYGAADEARILLNEIERLQAR